MVLYLQSPGEVITMRTLRDRLPSLVLAELPKLSPIQQRQFWEEYCRKEKSVALAYTFWLLFGLHYAYLGKWGMQFLHWFTLGGFFLWWLIDGIRIPSMVDDYNRDVSIDVLRNIKVISGGH